MKRISFSDIAYKQYFKELPYTCGSDYSGDTVTRSNYLEIKKVLSRYKGVYSVYGDFYGYGIA